MTSYLRRFDSLALVALLFAGGPAVAAEAAKAPAKTAHNPRMQWHKPTRTSKTKIGKLEIRPLAPLRTPVKKLTRVKNSGRVAVKSKIGSPCKHTDKKARLTRSGVVQLDACGRLYCAARAGVDIAHMHPNIHKALGCTWKVDNRKLCVCQRGKTRARKS
jgi:hypothetical protein